jgi:uncharacterized protein
MYINASPDATVAARTGPAIRALVVEAATCLNTLWPVSNFIACNALKGFEDQPFEVAVQQALNLFGARGFLPLPEYRALYDSGRITVADLQEAYELDGSRQQALPVVKQFGTIAEILDKSYGTELLSIINRRMIKWCTAYLDNTQAQWSMDAAAGLFKSWRRLVVSELVLTLHGAKNWKACLQRLPEEPAEAVGFLLAELGVEEADCVPYLRRHLAQLPGFASHLKWYESNGDDQVLNDYLAIRLFYETQLTKSVVKKFYDLSEKPWKGLKRLNESAFAELRNDDIGKASIWQAAYEINYRNRLIAELRQSAARKSDPAQGALCRLYFCIDVRSERIRRALESVGHYRTDGFAGFWGFAMQFKELFGALSVSLCPVLIQADKHVHEVSDDRRSGRLSSLQAFQSSFVALQTKLKSNIAAAFGMVESYGLLSALPLLGRTFFPRHFHFACQHTQGMITGSPKTSLDMSAYTLEEKVALAETNLKAMGLTKNFEPVIVLCGHRSTSVNNAYASALDCGACGGHAGEFSSKMAAQVLSDPQVRQGLKLRGTDIPDGTIFLAGEHNTTTDEFELFDTVALSEYHQGIVAKLKADFKLAGAIARKERSLTLPATMVDSVQDPLDRACDWAQVAPEWGLTFNAAFIASPSSLTRGVNLGGRTFLHSYDCREDADGMVLELLMTAPMVVAQWISTQYYLSTVDNKVFGSESKVVHNIVGDFGVMSGKFSDLRMGLPAQCIMGKGGVRAHEPMRLLVLIQAPLQSIAAVLSKHDELANLVKNRWITLVALDPESGDFFQAEGVDRWRRLDGKETGAFSFSPETVETLLN